MMFMSNRLRTGILVLIFVSVVIAQDSPEDACENEVWARINANKNNLTALQTITSEPWVSASEFRGTMSILQSCILTLIACIYTALHLNVPTRKSWQDMLLTKAKWVALTLFAPEIVLYMAADQFTQALWLKKKLENLRKSNDIQEHNVRYFPNFHFRFLSHEMISINLISSIVFSSLWAASEFPWIS